MKGPSTHRDGPVVSVIMPTFNRAVLLKESIESILSQTFSDFELIIIDNMSTDGTRGYVEGLKDARLKYFRNANNGIIAINRNFGIRRSTGRYVAFCDDDDLWEPDKLAVQTAFMDANANVGLSFGYAVDFGAGPTVGYLRFPKGETDGVRGYEKLFYGNRIATLTAMARRMCLDEVGLFDEALAFRNIEDYDLWLRIARRYPIASVGRVLGRYRIHPLAATADEVAEKKKLFNIIDKHRTNGWIDQLEAARLESHVNFTIGCSILVKGDPSYRRWYLKSFALDKTLKTALSVAACALPVSAASYMLRMMKSSRRERAT